MRERESARACVRERDRESASERARARERESKTPQDIKQYTRIDNFVHLLQQRFSLVTDLRFTLVSAQRFSVFRAPPAATTRAEV